MMKTKKLLTLAAVLAVVLNVHANWVDDLKYRWNVAKTYVSWDAANQPFPTPPASVSSADLGGKERSAASPFWERRIADAAERKATSAASRLVEDTVKQAVDEATLATASTVAERATEAAAQASAQLIGDTAQTIADETALLAAEEAYNAAQATAGENASWFTRNITSNLPTKESLGNVKESLGNMWESTKGAFSSAKETLSSTENIKAALTPKNMISSATPPEVIARTQELAAEAGIEYAPAYNPSWKDIAAGHAQNLQATCKKAFWDGHKWVTENPKTAAAVGVVGLAGLGYLTYRAYSSWERQVQRAVNRSDANALDEILAQATEKLNNEEFAKLLNTAYKTALVKSPTGDVVQFLRNLARVREITLEEPVAVTPVQEAVAIPVGGGWKSWIPSRPSWLGKANADVEQTPVYTAEQWKNFTAMSADNLSSAAEPKPQWNPAEQQLTLGDAINRGYVGAVATALATLFRTHYADYKTNPATRRNALTRLERAQRQASRLPESEDKESIQGLITQYTMVIQNAANQASSEGSF